MDTKRLAPKFGLRMMSTFALAVLALPHAFADADDRNLHASMHHQEKGKTPEQRRQINALVKIVRESTHRFRDVTAAEAEGYALQFGCVSGGEFGAMGLHFVKGDLVGDDVLDPTRPEIVIYEPTGDGRVRLTGVDFLVLKDVWDAKHPSPPELMGQLFHLFEAPNRFGLPAFYTLHVWAWKDNPNGAFVNWNPNVSCDGFAGEPGNAN
jgi:hypothetical protein